MKTNLYDLERDAWLRAQGFKVLRFQNAMIEWLSDDVLDAIVAAVDA